MAEEQNQVIHNKNYRIQVVYRPHAHLILFLFQSKINNSPVRFWQGALQDYLVEGKTVYILRNLCRVTNIYIQPHIPSITISLGGEIKLSLLLKDQTEEYEESDLDDQNLTYGVKYWRNQLPHSEINAIVDPFSQKIYLTFLQKTKADIKVGKSIISHRSFLKKEYSLMKQVCTKDNYLIKVFDIIKSSPSFHFNQQSNCLRIDGHRILPQIPFNKTFFWKKNYQEQQLYFPYQKIQLFRHIFLTEVLTHMIISQFSRLKNRVEKDRDGYRTLQYQHQDLEELRNWGYRYNQFRDHPIRNKKNKKKKNKSSEIQYSDDSDENDDRQKCIEQKENKKQKEKKTTLLEKMGINIKSKEGICSFLLISQEEKRKINQMRYCLSQMTQETDKTEAKINFAQLIFATVAKEDLIGRVKGEDLQKNQKMKHFMSQFKAKCRPISCFIEYTKQSFFHQILNTGLRIFSAPKKLAYLRLPFSHIFWSIKLLYHRQKRTLLNQQKQINKKRIIQLYRGCQMKQQEILILKKNIGGCIQMEGFISTSQRRQMGQCFATNFEIVIEVPVSNLIGTFDNGFANICSFSQHKSEREVLINAFNVFKILNLKQATEKDQTHRLFLEYGCTSPIEDKMKKSQNLLDAEYLLKIHEEELLQAKIMLKQNKKQISAKMYESLSLEIPKAEQKLKKRRQWLNSWAEEEYAQALKKLSSWQEQLILNINHQQKKIENIKSYGQLLYYVGQYKKAVIYCKRQIKQIQLVKSAEGYQWRKNSCLVQREVVIRPILSNSLLMIGRLEQSLESLKKQLSFFKSINFPEQEEVYCQTLYNMYFNCAHILEKNQEKEKYKKQLIDVLNKHRIKNTKISSIIIEMEKEKEGAKEKQQQQKYISVKQKKKQFQEKKKQLKKIKLFTYGKFTNQYLKQYFDLIYMLYREQKWRRVIIEGRQYLRIRKECPEVQSRLTTCLIFQFILKCCQKQKSSKNLSWLGILFAQFLASRIYNYVQFNTIILFIEQCLKLNQFTIFLPVLKKIIKISIKYKMQEQTYSGMIILSYSLAILSQCPFEMLGKFLFWAQNLYREQKYVRKKNQCNLIQYIFDINEEYKKDPKIQFVQRQKEYYDAGLINDGYEAMRKGKAKWRPRAWEEKRGQLIPWHEPFYNLPSNMIYINGGINNYMRQGKQIPLLFEYLRQHLNLYYCVMGDDGHTQFYLQRVQTIAKLHLNYESLNFLPSLLQFWSPIPQLDVFQMWDLKMDLAKTVVKIQHLRQSEKQELTTEIEFRRKLIYENKGVLNIDLNMNRKEVIAMKQIYARYKNHLINLKRFRSHHGLLSKRKL